MACINKVAPKSISLRPEGIPAGEIILITNDNKSV